MHALEDLAPDTATAQRAYGLARPEIGWKGFSMSGGVIFAEILRGGGSSFQVGVAMDGPRFHCSCPVRKMPCKHSLALYQLYKQQAALFQDVSDLPNWIPAKWKQVSSVKVTSVSERYVQRKEEMAAGLTDLEQWLRDLTRLGLGSLSRQPEVWEHMAARLVDMKLGGLGRKLRGIYELVRTEPDWLPRVHAAIGQLFLLVKALQRLDQLPEALAEEALVQAGVVRKKSEVLQGEGLKDVWAVLGVTVTQEDSLRARQVWLQGLNSNKMALLLDYAMGGQGFEQDWISGQVFEASVFFYPGAYPLRALVQEPVLWKHGVEIPELTCFPTWAAFRAAWATALGQNPWLQSLPVKLAGVQLLRDGAEWILVDAEDMRIPLALGQDEVCWAFYSLGAGRAQDVFGVWDGWALRLLKSIGPRPNAKRESFDSLE